MRRFRTYFSSFPRRRESISSEARTSCGSEVMDPRLRGDDGRGRIALIMALVVLLAPGSVVARAGAPTSEAELGRAVYTNCIACHGERGQGGFAPPLAGSATLKEDHAAIVHVVAGSVNMPPFGEQLSDDEIAAVLNHVRNSWGNRAAPITPADVAAIEAQLAGN